MGGTKRPASPKPTTNLPPKKTVRGGASVVLQGTQCMVFMLG